MTFTQNIYLSIPPQDHPAVKRFAASVGGTVEMVPVDQQAGPNGRCYWNTELVSQRAGARQVFGWILNWWPEKYVDAIHHTVVQLDDGSLRDFTTPVRTQQGKILFVRTDQAVNYKAGNRIPMRIIPLIDDPEVEQWKEARITSDLAHHQCAKLATEMKFQNLANWQNYLQWKDFWEAHMNLRAIHSMLAKHEHCYCGSGKPFAICHFDVDYAAETPIPSDWVRARDFQPPPDAHPGFQ
jgi:hypothetical protein